MLNAEENPKEAIILAGGFGSRLRSVVENIPKPMALINNKPFLEYIFNYLSGQNIQKVILSVGYKYDLITTFFGNNFNNISIEYAIEKEARGTGGGIKLACSKVVSADVVIINGDTFFPVNIHRMYNFYRSENADVTIAVKKMKEFDRYGVVDYDKSSKRVKGFREKKWTDAGFINGGVYIIKTRIFNDMDLPEKFSFEEEILEKCKDTLKILAFDESADQYFIDIGIPEDYQKAQYELERIGDR